MELTEEEKAFLRWFLEKLSQQIYMTEAEKALCASILQKLAS